MTDLTETERCHLLSIRNQLSYATSLWSAEIATLDRLLATTLRSVCPMTTDHLRVQCPTCRVRRGVACRRVIISNQDEIALWFATGSRAKVPTHRMRKERAAVAARKRARP